MLSLIDLEKNRETIEVTIGPKKASIRLSGTVEDPFFCGKDACAILEYHDTKQALQRNVYEEDRCFLSDLKVDVRGTSTFKSEILLGKRDILTYNEGRAVYVNEAGLYSLIMSSKAPFAREFKRFVCSVILPSIRKFGQFSLKQLTADLEQKLTLKETEKAAADEKAREAEQLLEQEKRFSLRLRQMVATARAKEPTQAVYVATTRTYAAQNRFKIGGVKSRSLLRSRLSTYNSGRAPGDKLYFCHVAFCHDFRQVEQRLERCVGEFREESEAELYVLHYRAAVEAVDYLSERMTEEVSKYKALFERLLHETLTAEPVVPEPILLNGSEFRTFRDGAEASFCCVDWDAKDASQRSAMVRSTLTEYAAASADALSGEPVRRMQYEQFLETVHHAKFNKKKMWPVIKAVAKELSIAVRY